MPPRLTIGELTVRVDGIAADMDRRFRDADDDRRDLRKDLQRQEDALRKELAEVAGGITEINQRGRNMSSLVLLAILSSFVFPIVIAIILKVFSS